MKRNFEILKEKEKNLFINNSFEITITIEFIWKLDLLKENIFNGTKQSTK